MGKTEPCVLFAQTFVHPQLDEYVDEAEQGVLLIQNSVQMNVQQLQMLLQSKASLVPAYYQSQQQENFSQPHQRKQVEHPLSQLHKQGDGASQQQQDSGMSLLEYFSSPEAIQSLLSDRDKLCQLLEQHSKLMQMLQERLGQL